jgi:hypothetical protein
MLIAAGLAITLAAVPPPMPPIVVQIVAASDITSTLIAGMLAETDAIWNDTGVTFLWERDQRRTNRRVSGESPYGATVLRLVIGHETHVSTRDLSRWNNTRLPLGWIVFDDPDTPEQEIYVSYENATTLLTQSYGVVGGGPLMPRLQRETYLARAMGRALSHELGHYLSASKIHAPSGLMTATHSAYEFFSSERTNFRIAPAERQHIADRLTSIYLASRG